MLNRERIITINHHGIKFYALIEIKTNVENQVKISGSIIDYERNGIGGEVVKRRKSKCDPLQPEFMKDVQKEIISEMMKEVQRISDKEKERPDLIKIGFRAIVPDYLLAEAFAEERGAKSNDADA